MSVFDSSQVDALQQTLQAVAPLVNQQTYQELLKLLNKKTNSLEYEYSLHKLECLMNLKVEFEALKSRPILEWFDVLENAHDWLDTFFKSTNVGQERMLKLVGSLETLLIQEAKIKLGILDFNNEELHSQVSNALLVCERWMELNQMLSRLWKSDRFDGPIQNEDLELFIKHLESILSSKSLHTSVLSLLDEDEQQEYRMQQFVFDALFETSFETKQRDFYKYIKSLESVLTRKVMDIFDSLYNQPEALIKQFEVHSELIQLFPTRLEPFKESVKNELLTQLRAISNKTKKEVKLKNTSPTVSVIIWNRQMMAKVQTSIDIFKRFFEDEMLQKNAFKILDDLKKDEKEYFNEWAGKAESIMETSFVLNGQNSLLNLDYASGKLLVNYSDETVTLLRETRQLQSLGFSVPLPIQKYVEQAQKYYKMGVTLKQIAHFYNTIEQQMIPSQQAMLLNQALTFENRIKALDATKTKGVQETDLEEKITKLQQAAEDLTAENRKLQKYHSTLTDYVLKLMNIDLVKYQPKWKEILTDIRALISSLHESGLKPSDTLSWRNHWDYQLYKALEHQYKVGLVSIHETLSEISVELVFKNQKLQFRPPMEEIRSKYYREMKKFINLPSNFKPLGETGIFTLMADQNAESLAKVYAKADHLFNSLSKALDPWKSWVLFGEIDIEEFVGNALVDVGDWEVNFKMLKVKGRELEQMPNSIKVDCISISCLPVKAAIEDHLQRIYDALMNTLKRSVNHHVHDIEVFIERGTQALLKRPQTMEDIGHARQEHEHISKERSSLGSYFDKVERKNKLLRSVGATAVDISAMQAKWSKLELMLDSHELMVKEQVDSLKSAIDTRIQVFIAALEKFSAHWYQFKPKVDTTKIAKAIQFIKEKNTEFAELEATANQISQDALQFGMSPPEFPGLDQVREDIKKSSDAWSISEGFMTEMDQMKQEDWITFRTRVFMFEDFISRWTEKIRSKTLDDIATHLLKEIDSLKLFVPCCKFIRGDTWMPEHWSECFRFIGLKVNLAKLTFGNLLDARTEIIQNIDAIKELNNRANGEVSIREAIQELDMWGASTVFSLTKYQDASGSSIKLIKDWKELMTQVGDNLSLIQSLKDSPYYKAFEDRSFVWEQKLSNLDEYLRQLNLIQRRWVYLEPIFSRGSLPSEKNRFARINDDFHSIMSSIQADNRVVSLTNFPNIGSTLTTLADQLERCQKALNEFLEQKRSRFARFYFLGDDDLLEILGQAKNPAVIQAHLKKLFAGVHNVLFNENMTAITGMKSLHGEIVPLKNPVTINEDVEHWLQAFTLEMKSTLQELLLECIQVADLSKFPLQIMSAAEHVHFTSSAEVAIQNNSFDQLKKELEANLEKYTSFDSSIIQDKNERSLMELKVKSIILDLIHFLDVVDQLKQANTKSIHDWSWRKQLRFYIKDKRCLIKMNEAEFEYTYEYQGIPPKLVHTPLTDKCFLTLTQAMDAGFGGNPFGPAGTGKTESVKALGNLFGRQVLVFNCDEGIDYKSMGRIFVGLIKCGAWGCFDEFNRLDESVLSAVSQQIQVIQAGLKNKDSQVTLLDKKIDLDLNSAIFVTMNPAGKGYGGRQKLPDNLKQLFRSVAMTQPDNELISETILFSEGFHNGKELGRKVVAAYTLSKQLLSHQQHYDWGLRPLKASLGLAGSLLHEAKRQGSVDQAVEEQVIVKALRLSTLSKLTFKDAEKYKLLLNDLFPQVKLQESGSELLDAIRQACADLKLSYLDNQAAKVVQLYEALRQRMGVVIVGPSGSGKSTLLMILKSALKIMEKRIVSYEMNPKAVDRHILLGHMDLDTREWTDGILTFAARQAVKEPLETTSWIICDGDIDPEWIESLNSVLDDNRLLTMPNGERIQFGPNINFLFETHNLTFASPATVSRMGMIYLSDESLDVKVVVEGWKVGKSESLVPWIDAYFYKSVDWIRTNASFIVETTKLGVVYAGLSHLAEATSKLEFLFALVRGFCSNMSKESLLKYTNELFKWANQPVDAKRLLDSFVVGSSIEPFELTEPDGVEMTLDIDQVPVIETPDFKRLMATIIPWIKQSQPFLIVGPEGAGKHTLLRHCFSKVRGLSVSTIHCNAQTNSDKIIQRLTYACVASTSVKGRVLRPRDAEKLILYLKDINLPKPDKYDTVELIQFLQQLITYKGFYDKHLEWVSIENVVIVGSMNPSTTVGRHKLSSRFSSIVRIAHMGYADKDQLSTIYQYFLSAILSTSLPGHQMWSLPKNISKLTDNLLSIYESVTTQFTRDLYPHYQFSPRDITRLVLTIARYQFTGKDDHELLEVVAHECCRLYQDKLVSSESRIALKGIVNSCLRTDWNYNDALTGFIYANEKTLGVSNNPSQLMRVEASLYRETIEKKMMMLERDSGELDLTLIPETLQQLSKVERVLGHSGSSLLCAGTNGVKFTPMITLAAFNLGYTIISPKITRNYTIKSFINDLKIVAQKSGIENQNIILLLETYQLIDPKFLELVNSLLSGSDVSGIFTREELDALISSLKEEYSQTGFLGNLMDYFSDRIRKNLHIVLIMDTKSTQFVVQCESNPALYNKCQMIWTENWSPESMVSLATKIFEAPLDTLDKNNLIKSMINIHNSTMLNSQYFFNFLSTYRKVYCEKLTECKEKSSYLEHGLDKLNEASAYVDQLSTNAKKQQILLAEKQKAADVALKQITDSMVEAADQKNEMEALTVTLRNEEENLVKSKSSIENELSEVEPILRAAKSAVGEIRNESLSEVRSLRAPPPAIRDVLEGVMRLMGVLDMSWNSMKSFLGKRTFKEEIMNYDARKITKQIYNSVSALLEEKKESFEEANIKRVSLAAAPLAMWVKANLTYSKVIERVAPLEENLAKLTDSLNASRERVLKLKEALDKVDQKVASLKEEFGTKTREAETVKQDLEKALAVIQRSQGLLEKLSAEGERWKLQSSEIGETVDQLPWNTLLSAAFITYLSSSPEDARKSTVKDWSNTTGISFKFSSALSNEGEQLNWKMQGLPSDELSNENAIILQYATSPLIVDPSGQATAWLKTTLASKKPEVVKQTDDGFIKALELAIRFGKTLIVEYVSQIEPFLIPLLRREFKKQGPRLFVELGDKLVDYNNEFQLYLVTNNPSFSLLSEHAGLVTVINFSITRAGLTGQILGITLKHEKPELEQQRLDLIKTKDELRMELSRLEDQLLNALANSEGNILENQALISSLNETKTKSIKISASLQESQVLESNLESQRSKYEPIAKFASSLFFVISDLKHMNHVYSFSLPFYLRLFSQVLEMDCGDKSPDSRVSFIISCLEKTTYVQISRSLFKADRYFFAMHMIHSLHPELFGENEFEYFTDTFVTDEKPTVPTWVPSECAGQVSKLMSLKFGPSCKLNEECWMEWFRTKECETRVPKEKLSPVQKLLVIKALRPDRLLTAMSNFIKAILGLDSLSSDAFKFEDLVTESTPKSPILLLITPGTDPSQDIRDLSAKKNITLHQVSMGQGQGDVAIQLLKDCAHKGEWLCLQNVHLVISWLPLLQKELNSMSFDDNFRLWLVSEAHNSFPRSLLELSYKITIESPPGIKNNLLRIYQSWNKDYLQQGSQLRAQALYSLALFHAIIQERRNYLPQGWTKFYEFSAADLRSSADIITKMIKSNQPIQWQILHGLLKDAIYGGRIEDKGDQLKLETYLKQHFNDDVYHLEQRQPTKKLLSLQLPKSNDYSVYMDLIKNMTDFDFGLPANIDRVTQKEKSNEIIQQLQAVSLHDISNVGFDREKWSLRLVPILQLWKKSITTDLLERKITFTDTTDPIVSFLEMEVATGLTSIRTVNQQLNQLSNILKKSSLPTPDILQVGSSLLKNTTPQSWLNMCDGSETVTNYLSSLISKTLALSQLNATNLTCISLGLFFNPLTFLNALKQKTARDTKVSLDTLKLETSWSSTDGTQIKGLILQGANFDGSRLSPCSSTDPLSIEAPVCSLKWTPNPTNNGLSVPLYENMTREKRLFDISVPCTDPEQWIQYSVAFFLY